METTFRLAGLAEAAVDSEKNRVNFVLKTTDGNRLLCKAEAAAARQIASALGTVALKAKQSGSVMIGAEKVAKYGVKADAFGEAILLQLISEDGVPYMFAIPPHAAADIAARLKSESDRKPGTGRA